MRLRKSPGKHFVGKISLKSRQVHSSRTLLRLPKSGLPRIEQPWHDHVLVYIDTGQRTYLVETTNDTNMEPYTNGVKGWLGSRLSSNNENMRYPVSLH